MVKIYRNSNIDIYSTNTTLEKSKRIGKPYSQQPGRKHGEGSGHIIDKPEPGKIYSLTGGHGQPSISSGNTWAESEVKEEKPKTIADQNAEDYLDEFKRTNEQQNDYARKQAIEIAVNKMLDLDLTSEEIFNIAKKLKIVPEKQEELEETNPLNMPEELWDDVVVKHEAGMDYKELVDDIQNNWLGRKWFAKYRGNEFDLRQELEDALTSEEG